MSFSSNTKNSLEISAEQRRSFTEGAVDELMWEGETPGYGPMDPGTTHLEASHGSEPTINDLDVAEPTLLAVRVKDYPGGSRALLKRNARAIEAKWQAAEDAAARKRMRLLEPAPPKLCAFGFLHGTDQPQMVGSIRSDTLDWQSVLILDAGDVNNLPSLTLLIQHAAVPQQAPIVYNLKEHLEFSLQWPLFNDASEEKVIHSFDSWLFDDWYDQVSPSTQALSVLQKIKSDPKERVLTVMECAIGKLPSFQHFPDLRSWRRLPEEARTQLEKAMAGEDVITFIIDAKKPEVSASLEDLKEQVKGAADPRTTLTGHSIQLTTGP
ncbi:MAG: hypothetical protein LQ337_007497 [Flavoplaca oasis]|nr:MAG: hypothetical protein LQ337_007497 [Flavoplaca oasis]